MRNDPSAARAYHERTKHSLESVQRNPHRLVWEIQPLPFKIYETLEPIALPRDFGAVEMPTLEAIRRASAAASRERDERVVPDLRTLARLFYYSAGVTKERVYSSGQHFYFRAAACTGALYHIELYLACGDLPGLDAGLYHFGAHDFSLRRLRAGDHRGALVRATGAEPSVAQTPAIVICTSTFWRNAWKYQARAYRHCWWDSGTLLAHLLAVAAAEAQPARVVLGFVDADVNALLGLDVGKEAALALVSIGHDPANPAPPISEASTAPALELAVRPLSSREVDYPTIREMHEGSSLADAASVRAWRERSGEGQKPHAETHGGAIPLRPVAAPPDAPLGATVIKRGSTRRFAHEPISFEQLSTIIESSYRPVPFDFRPVGGAPLDDLYLILNAMDGLEPGSYALELAGDGVPDSGILMLRQGSFRREAGYLGLGQELPADAAVNTYFMSELDPILDRFGARGYRCAQLEAAIHGGWVYLAAYALGLGATGLTFFDDDVTSFFSPHAEGKAVMFLAAIGKPLKRRLRTA